MRREMALKDLWLYIAIMYFKQWWGLCYLSLLKRKERKNERKAHPGTFETSRLPHFP